MTRPTSVAKDITPQKRRDVGSIARMSRLIRITMTGIIPAITAFIESHSGRNERRPALRYEPPSILRMKSA